MRVCAPLLVKPLSVLLASVLWPFPPRCLQPRWPKLASAPSGRDACRRTPSSPLRCAAACRKDTVESCCLNPTPPWQPRPARHPPCLPQLLAARPQPLFWADLFSSADFFILADPFYLADPARHPPCPPAGHQGEGRARRAAQPAAAARRGQAGCRPGDAQGGGPGARVPDAAGVGRAGGRGRGLTVCALTRCLPASIMRMPQLSHRLSPGMPPLVSVLPHPHPHTRPHPTHPPYPDPPFFSCSTTIVTDTAEQAREVAFGSAQRQKARRAWPAGGAAWAHGPCVSRCRCRAGPLPEGGPDIIRTPGQDMPCGLGLQSMPT